VIRIAFLALAQAHQHLHWIPAALRLAREPGVRVHVLCPSRAGLRFIRGYDAERRLRYHWLWTTPRNKKGKLLRQRDGLFTLPRRSDVLDKWGRLIGRFPFVVTTESTSIRLKDDPRFRSKMIRIRHGAGDGERIFDPRICSFDLTLMPGEKDKRRLIEVGHVTDSNAVVTGYAKFELVRPPEPLFADEKPVVLYNPHSNPELSSWHAMGAALIDQMRQLPQWNFIVAPHVKARGGPQVRSEGNVLVDLGSRRSIDMTYTQAADLYLGDVSSQVYEFLHAGPRPCVFIDAHGVEGWEEDARYANWHLGQLIRRPEELGPALDRAARLQPSFRAAQEEQLRWSVAEGEEPASERQARAILKFIAGCR
jgi:hypothetical protein